MLREPTPTPVFSGPAMFQAVPDKVFKIEGFVRLNIQTVLKSPRATGQNRHTDDIIRPLCAKDGSFRC